MNERVTTPTSFPTGNALGSLGSSTPPQNPDRKSFSCLVVEDDITIRHLVTNYLEDH